MKLRVWEPKDEGEDKEVRLRLTYDDHKEAVQVEVVNEDGISVSSGILLRIDKNGVYRYPQVHADLGWALTARAELVDFTDED